jgi:hypothetical protein
MNNVAAEKRRSDRLWLTIPVRVRGVDSIGGAVEIKGWATSLNRHGGRIQVPQEMDWSRPVRLRKPIGNYEVEFRVVESIKARGSWGWEYGVECLDETLNFWDIEFGARGRDARGINALLDCGLCHTLALMPVTISEFDRLRTIGMTIKYCAKCSSVTHWWYAESSMPKHREPLSLSHR